LMESRVATLHAEFKSEESEALKNIETEQDTLDLQETDKIEMAVSRKSIAEKRKTRKYTKQQSR